MLKGINMGYENSNVLDEKPQRVLFTYDCKDLVFVEKDKRVGGVYRIKCPACDGFLLSMDTIPSNLHCRCSKCKAMWRVEKPIRNRN